MQELYLSKKQLPFVIVIDKIEPKRKKEKKYVFKPFVKCHENWKKSKNYLLIVLSPAKQKKSNLKISSKSIRTDRKLIKLIRKLIKTDQKLMSSLKSFLSFLFPPKNNAFLQVIFMKSENHFGVLKKNMLESSQ